jgi:hypothetical protein
MDVFARLGLSSDATPEEIQRKRREFARKLHSDQEPPERRAMADALLSEINVAADEALRIAHERSSPKDLAAVPAPPPPPSTTTQSAGPPKDRARSPLDATPFADLIESFTSRYPPANPWVAIGLRLAGVAADTALKIQIVREAHQRTLARSASRARPRRRAKRSDGRHA